MKKIFKLWAIIFIFFLIIVNKGFTKEKCDIFNGIFIEQNELAPQLSTADFKKAVTNGNAVIIDNRPYKEWAISHIPGAIVVSPKPGLSKAFYTSDVDSIKKITRNKEKKIILYCDGINCNKSRRVSKALKKEGFINVFRYQLGIPVWLALGFPAQCELEGIEYVYSKDKTSVFIDSREKNKFKQTHLRGSKNIPYNKIKKGKDTGEILKAKNDGRLPVADRNTRIIVFGNNPAESEKVAEALAKEAFHNVCFYGGSLKNILKLDKK